MNEQTTVSKLILVAEDEMDMQSALVTALEEMGGFRVLAVGDGESAVMRSLQEKPDFILLDIRMPRLSGDKVLEQIRQDEAWGKHVPVTILTAQSDMMAVSNAIAVGGPSTGYLIKSDVSLAQVVDHVRNRLM